MRRNRRVRNQLEIHLGSGVVKEIERWNDGQPDSLVDFGVPMSDTEAALQEDSYLMLGDQLDLGTV